MKVDTQQRTVQSTMNGDTARMGIAEGAEAHIMSILTDLYEDPELAVIREYSTNGYDAHIEAGVKRPIEVQTPTALSQFLTIRDYGCGLTVDDIHSTYSQYGASTKRSTNDQVGMLGLGCKSALTYADQFTLTSVKDGTRAVVVVGRDEDGAGTMTIMDTRATDDEDGTEVMIPAKRHNSIADKAATFFSYWPEGSVLLDGKPPARFDALKLTDTLYLSDDGEDHVVMGNVPYPTTIDLGIRRDFGLIAFVPIGSVTFPPDRESLMDTAKTRACKEQIAKDYHASIGGVIQREVDAAPTASDAIRTVVKWAHYVPNAQRKTAGYTYKGETIPVSYIPTHPTQTRTDGTPMPVPMQAIRLRLGRPSYYRRSSGSIKLDSVPVHDWPGTIWLVNFVPAKMNKQHRDKAEKWLTDKGIDFSDAGLLVGDPTKGPSSPFIDSKVVLDWTEVRKVQLQPRATNGKAPRIPGSYDVYVNGSASCQTETPGDKIDLSQPVFWVHGNYWQARRYAEILAAHYPKFSLVCLPGGRIEKFKRNVPQAKSFTDGLTTAAEKWAKSLKPDVRKALAMEDARSYGSGHDLLRRLDASRVKDPALKEAVKLAKINLETHSKSRRAFERYLSMDSIVKEKWTNPLKQYPLAQGYSGNVCDHLYLYLNAAYEASK